MACGFVERWVGCWEGGARWNGGSVAAPGGSARDQKRTLVLPRFWPRGYTEIGSRGNVFGTIFGFIFRTQNWSRFSGSLKETFLKSKKRPHFQVQKTDLKMVPKIVRGFLVFGFDGVRFSTAGGSDSGASGWRARARPPRPRGPDGRPFLEEIAAAIVVCWQGLRAASF